MFEIRFDDEGMKEDAEEEEEERREEQERREEEEDKEEASDSSLSLFVFFSFSVSFCPRLPKQDVDPLNQTLSFQEGEELKLRDWSQLRRGWSQRTPQTLLDALANMDVNSVYNSMVEAEGEVQLTVLLLVTRMKDVHHFCFMLS